MLRPPAGAPSPPPPHGLARRRLVRVAVAAATAAAAAGGGALWWRRAARQEADRLLAERAARAADAERAARVSGQRSERRGAARRADASFRGQPAVQQGAAARRKQPHAQQPPPEPVAIAQPPPPSGLSDSAVDLAVGALAEAAAVATLYPVDTLKVRCQLSRHSAAAELRALFRPAGAAGAARPSAALRALYAGCAPAVLGAALFGSAYMLCYQSFYRRCVRAADEAAARSPAPAAAAAAHHHPPPGASSADDAAPPPPPPPPPSAAPPSEPAAPGDGLPLHVLGACAALSACAANCATAVVEVPLDSARQRLQAGVATGSMAALVRSSARAGGAAALYAGFVPFLLRTVPQDALSFCAYEALQRARERLAEGDDPGAGGGGGGGAAAVGPGVDMLLGGLAGGISALLTMPLDTIKTHVNCTPGGRFGSAARAIWAASGPGGFFAGTTSRLAERVPASAVYWLAAEATRRVLAPTPVTGGAAGGGGGGGGGGGAGSGDEAARAQPQLLRAAAAAATDEPARDAPPPAG